MIYTFKNQWYFLSFLIFLEGLAECGKKMRIRHGKNWNYFLGAGGVWGAGGAFFWANIAATFSGILLLSHL